MSSSFSFCPREKGPHLFLNVRFSKNVQQAGESLRPLTALTYNIPHNTIGQAPAGNFLDSLPSLRNKDREWFTGKNSLMLHLGEAQTIGP